MHGVTLSNREFNVGWNAFPTISKRSSDVRAEINILRDILL